MIVIINVCYSRLQKMLLSFDLLRNECNEYTRNVKYEICYYYKTKTAANFLNKPCCDKFVAITKNHCNWYGQIMPLYRVCDATFDFELRHTNLFH